MKKFILAILSLVVTSINAAQIGEPGVLDPKPFAMLDSLATAPAYAQSLCHQPELKCVKVKQGDTWYQLFPNFQHREIAMRLNRTNVALAYRGWIVEPKSWNHLNYMDLSPFPAQRKATGQKLILVDLSLFAFAAYAPDGQLIYWGPAASGKDWCADTDESCKTALGHYQVYRKKGKDCESGTYPIDTKGGAPMPYCMYYYKGFALHGSTLSGFSNRSRGCIRLFYDDAKWLNEAFVKYGTKVIVKP